MVWPCTCNEDSASHFSHGFLKFTVPVASTSPPDFGAGCFRSGHCQFAWQPAQVTWHGPELAGTCSFRAQFGQEMISMLSIGRRSNNPEFARHWLPVVVSASTALPEAIRRTVVSGVFVNSAIFVSLYP